MTDWVCPDCKRVTVLYLPALEVWCPGPDTKHKHLKHVKMKPKGGKK